VSAVLEPVAASGELVLPEPIGKQPEWLDSPATRKVLRVGRRGSKTRFALIAAMAGHGPGWEDGRPSMRGVLQGGDVVWIAQNYTNLSTVLWREEIVPRMGHLPWVNLNVQKHDVEIPGVGALLLRSGDREAIDSIRGIGKRLFGVIVDEAAWLDLRGALQDVILLALADNDGWLILMSTTNAGADGGYDDTGAPQIPSYFNLLCTEIRAGKRSDEWQEFTGTAFDNPTLSPKAIQDLIDEYPPDSPKLQQEVYAALLESGVGLALPGLSDRHVTPAFAPEGHWTQFAAFDWGYQHPWAMGLYCADEDGTVYKQDSLVGRLDLPEQIDAKARAGGFDPKRMVVFAGGDCWRQRMKKGEFAGPTIAEELMKLGWRMVAANDARVAGLNNLRRYTYLPPDRPDARPRFQWMDTAGNRACLAQMQRMPLNPSNSEDALKVDADSSGRGGDDMYDETRYGLMSRPLTSVPSAAVDEEGKSMGYNYAKHRPNERPTADALMSEWLGEPQTATVGRYRIPVRR